MKCWVSEYRVPMTILKRYLGTQGIFSVRNAYSVVINYNCYAEAFFQLIYNFILKSLKFAQSHVPLLLLISNSLSYNIT